MLFRKDIEPSCSYCRHSAPLGDEEMICIKKGIVEPWSKCSKFSYDPLKRIPAKQLGLKTTGIKAEDFEII